MTHEVLEFTQHPAGYRLRVHLDRARKQEDGSPDPAWVHEWSFANLHPEIHTQHGKPLTEKQFLANVLEELPRMVEVALRERGHAPSHSPGRSVLAGNPKGKS